MKTTTYAAIAVSTLVLSGWLFADPDEKEKSVEQFAKELQESLAGDDSAFKDLVERARENGGNFELDLAEFEKLMAAQKRDGNTDEKADTLLELRKFLEGMRQKGGSRPLSPDEVERLFGADAAKGQRPTAEDENDGSSAGEAFKGFMDLFQRRMQGRKIGKNEREHGTILDEYRPVVAEARLSTVSLVAGRKQLALGTVVDSDGYIITKASEVARRDLRCVFPGGVRVSAKVIDVYQPLDLALVKVDADGLEVADWADGDEPIELGTFLAAPGIGEDPIAIGVASVAARNLSEKTKGFLGVTPEGSAEGVRLVQVLRGTPAEKAGLEVGDIVLEVNGVDIPNRAEFHRLIAGRSPGEKVKFKIDRDGDEQTLSARLVSREFMAQLAGGARRNPRVDRMNLMGGDLSENRAGYTSAMQTDLTLEPSECGGPVVNLDGKVVGVNIARGGRVKSYAVPVKDLILLLGDIDSGKFTITDLGELREAASLAENALEKAQASLAAARDAKKAADAALERAEEKQEKVKDQKQ